MLDSLNSELKLLPLNRVAAKDGLLITAQLWQEAHEYHRRKQNLLFQSFHTPGILTGLGVSVIQAPEDIPAQYRDSRWLRIQPGMAADLQGNVIIVTQPMDFHIASAIKSEETTIYLVISYVDPDQLQANSEQEIVTETFRIDEKILPPQGSEIELCRIHFSASSNSLSKVILSNAKDLFHPEPSTIDLRYRLPAGLRPQKFLSIAQVVNNNYRLEEIEQNFSALLRSLAGLYPQMDGDSALGKIDLNQDEQNYEQIEALITRENKAMIYLDYQQIENLSASEIEILKLWSDSGSTILVEYRTQDSDLGDLKIVEQQLLAIINELEQGSDLMEDKDSFQQELISIENVISEQVMGIVEQFQTWAGQLGINMNHSGQITTNHLLRQSPFLFSRFPIVEQQAIDIFNWQNLILVIGNLTTSWSIDQLLSRDRQQIRTCQEMGINILNFAWQWHQIHHLSRQP